MKSPVRHRRLSYYYISRKEIDEAIVLLAQASIADIKSATKETAAMSSLAELLYNNGDIRNAYTYIQHAMEDAIYYGARQRKVGVSMSFYQLSLLRKLTMLKSSVSFG